MNSLIMKLFNNHEVKFLGFEPGQKLREQTHQMVERLHWQAPSDATLRIDFIKTSGLYRINCRIQSMNGVFVADAASEHAVAAIKMLERKMKQQLLNWKVKRTINHIGLDFVEVQRVS